MGNAGSITYQLGGDASKLREAFEYALRYKDDFLNQLKRAFSVRGLFDGLTTGIKDALGGANLGELISKGIRGLIDGEQLQQQFEGLLGDGPAIAAKTLRELKAFASDAGFAQKEVLDAAAGMIGMDMNSSRAIESLKMLGDVARGTPKASLSGLADVWGKMFESGGADTRSLMALKGMGVSLDALAAAIGTNREELVRLAETGELTFGQIDDAMRALTSGNGRFAGQIERYKDSLGSLVEDTKETFGKIPGAFFAGILGVGFGQAKERVKEIRATLQGWVEIARDFGETLGVALKTVAGLWKDGQLFSALWKGLQGAFGAALDYLVLGLQSAAAGFGAAIVAAAEYAANVIAWKLNPVSKQGDKPRAGDIGSAAAGAFSATWKGGDPDGILARNFAAFNEMVGPRMFEARGGFSAEMSRVMFPLRYALGSMVPGAFAGGGTADDRGYLPRKNDPRALPPMSAALQKFTAPDDYARIGLYVGAGGPQGEAHARDTAKNTAATVDQLKNIKKIIGRRGRAAF